MNRRDPRYPRECGRCDGILLRASAEQRKLLLVSRRGPDQAQIQNGNCSRRSIEVSKRTQGDAPNWSVYSCHGADTGGDEGERGVDIELDTIGYIYGYIEEIILNFLLQIGYNWIYIWICL